MISVWIVQCACVYAGKPHCRKLAGNIYSRRWWWWLYIYVCSLCTIVADPALIHWKCQCKCYIPVCVAQREIYNETNIWYTDYKAGNLHVFDVPIKVFRWMQSKTALSLTSKCSSTLCHWSSTNSCWQSSVFPSRPLPLSLQHLSDFFVTLKQRAHEQQLHCLVFKAGAAWPSTLAVRYGTPAGGETETPTAENI